MLSIVLREVSRHLQRRIHRHVKGQLLADGSGHIIVLGIRIEAQNITLKDAGGIIHRSALKPGKGHDSHLMRSDAAAVFIALGGLVADEIGPGTAQACRTDAFVHVDHYPIFSSFP